MKQIEKNGFEFDEEEKKLGEKKEDKAREGTEKYEKKTNLRD